MPASLTTDHNPETRDPASSVTVEGASSPGDDRALSGRLSQPRHIRLVETESSALAFSSVSLILQAATGHDADFSGFAA